MTDQEILALSAGPALDALVAERILGLVPCDNWKPSNMGSAGGPCLLNWFGGCAHNGKCYPRETYGQLGGPPSCSTDIAAAWLVVGHFWTVRQKDVRVTLSCGDIYAEIGNVLAGEVVEACGDTVPEAICRAALLAVGGQA